MDYTTIALGLLLAFTLFHGLSTLARKTKKLPPGPTPLPIIGNLHLFGGQFHTTLTKLTKIYGPIMCLKLGSVTTVIVSSPSVAREILQKQDSAFSGKKVPDALHAHNHYKYSVVWLPANSQWRTLRKILTTNIFTNNRLEANQHLRFNKVQELIAHCRKSSETGEAVEVGQAAFRTTLNMLSNTIFSKDLADYHSESAKEFKDAVWNIMLEPAKPNMVDFFPVLEKLDPQGIRRRMSVHVGKVLKIFDGLFTDRLEQRRLHGASNNDVLDVFLNYCEEHPNEIDRNHIKHTCLDLFIAGTDTTTSATEWAMAELLKNPEIMRKAKNELEEVIGKGKSIEEADVARLPYLRCIVKETLRIHPPGPFLFPRKSEQDVEVCGYTIPKESQVIVNIWALGRDSSLWANPLVFNPERFLESNLDIRGHNFELLPFGAGRRICPGLPLAIKMVPLMLGSLINSFDWKLEGDIVPEELNLEEKAGIALQMAHHLRAVPIAL